MYVLDIWSSDDEQEGQVDLWKNDEVKENQQVSGVEEKKEGKKLLRAKQRKLKVQVKRQKR